MDDETFGKLLRAARKRAGFHTIAAFADSLSEYGLAYTDDAIGHWENDRRKPYHSDKDRLNTLKIFQLLVEKRGIEHTTQIDAMLLALNRPALSNEEKAAYFPNLGIPIANLPEKPPYDRLVGRDEVLEAVSDALQDTAGKPVIVVSGLGGIGKTAVAYEVINRVMQSGRFEKLAWETTKSEEFTGVGIRQRREQIISFPNVLASYARQLGFESLTTQPPEVDACALTGCSALQQHFACAG
ncbi:ATP-binding protein [bacterium]|nr:ATP-binding protein [bacterium]